MARIRTIKPEFFRHDELYEAEKASGLPLRIAFAGLWTVADREGRFKWKPSTLKLDCLPFDDLDFANVMALLAKNGFIIDYEVDGKRFGWISSWKDHQKINSREAESQIPEYKEEYARMCTHPPKRVHAQGEGKGREGKGRDKICRKTISYPEDFLSFWNAYPTDPNMSKKEAHAEWKKISETDQQSAINSMPAFKNYCGDNPDYRPIHACRYLSKRRFDGHNEIEGYVVTVSIERGSPQFKAWLEYRQATGELTGFMEKSETYQVPSEWPPRVNREGVA